MRSLICSRGFSSLHLAKGEYRAGVVSGANFDVTAVSTEKVVSLASGEEHSTVQVRKSIFARAPIRNDLLQRVVVWQLAKRRAGLAKSKNLAEVSGSTAKGAPQKGRGKARQGAKRAPQFRGGGRAFPKRPRSFDFALPHQIRRLGLAHAISSKFHSGRLVLVDHADQLSGRTRDLEALCDRLGWSSVLFISGESIPGNSILILPRLYARQP